VRDERREVAERQAMREKIFNIPIPEGEFIIKGLKDYFLTSMLSESIG
jgi:hypothetical protein